MTDPYRVLGVPTTATDDEIKAAYRALAKKYHPDNYLNNPLADLAEAKMREINEAYDQIQMERTARRQNAGQRAGQSAGQGADRGDYRYSGISQFADIRRMIDQNRIVDAEELLDGIPDARRDAEWYYLKGVIHYKRGWLEEAMNCFVMANRLQPNNPEYQAALNRMMWQRNTAAPAGRPMGCSCTGCDFCTSLICADCCCECMGGDLVRCC